MANQADDNLRKILKPGPDCLSAEELGGFIEHEASVNPVFESHLRVCARCQGELALMRSFLSSAITTEEQPHVDAIVRKLEKARPVRRRSWRERLITPWAWGPAVAIAALAVVLIFNPRVEQPRGDVVVTPGSGVYRSQSVELLQPSGEVAQVPAVISWKPVPGTARYRVRLLEVDRTVVWESFSEAASIPTPAEMRQAAVPGRWLMCEVDALDTAGSVVAGSGDVRFRVQPHR